MGRVRLVRRLSTLFSCAKTCGEAPPSGAFPLDDAFWSYADSTHYWEMNWMAYNYGRDVALPGATGQPVVYFMYPQAKTAEGRVDPFDPDSFKYEITVKGVT